MPEKLHFLLTRLKKASLAELSHRVREELTVYRQKRAAVYGNSSLPVPFVSPESVAALKLPEVKSHLSANDLKKLIEGDVWRLNSDAEAISRFETRVRKTCYSDISSKPGDPDIRAVWEPARLQHAAALLLHAHLNPLSEIALCCRDYARITVFKWINNNPFLFGPHYRSAMECGLRLPVFLYALKCLRLDGTETAAILSTIYHHAWWIERRLSLYSSLGNHTICECVGLVFAGAVFRNTKEGKVWLDRGIRLLQQELHHQILADGGPAEQSLNYHRFVLDLYWLTADFLEKNRLCDCSNWKPRLRSGEMFMSAFQDGSGNLPQIGDSDDGSAIAPGIIPLREITSTPDMRTITFPDSGYTVLRPADGTVLTFDHGPLGMAPLYNHGHADALSITIAVNGYQLLVDPGTFRYNGAPEWRKYFKSTRAHNTVTIDALDQAAQETGFIWSSPYSSSLKRREDSGRRILLEAVNNGYTRIKQPVTHKRTILLAEEGLLLVRDTFAGRGRHDFELNFHIHPDAHIAMQNKWWHLQRGDARLYMTMLEGDSFNSCRGQEGPLLGWYSAAYGIKQESSVLQCRKSGLPGQAAFLTAISLTGPVNNDILEQMKECL